ncbi:MAG: NACHT domain-containing protein [Verrucomicrobiota bacterium]
MNPPTAIRLLASGNNERGDLFTRLTRDLFFALGYDDLRLDVHKSGRELDIQGAHRLEPRRVVGECKAYTAKMGGDALNKFFGVLTRERKKSAPTPVTGYFVSVSGFTETGIEQENETGDERIILLNAERVIRELERSRVIVGYAQAAERAGQCAQHAGVGDAALDGVELLGHARGYVWAVFYARGKQRTHFALIHADGTALAEPVAREVIDADQRCSGEMIALRYLAPAIPTQDRVALVQRAAAHYKQWLVEECGYIQLDGLPADTDLSATRLKLERLFVPLKASFIPDEDDHSDAQQTLRDLTMTVGELLEGTPRLALLAMPGGGKSTLLKRLATAYAFPERREEIADNLPSHDWLPLILRCRELRDRAHRPILELLDDIPRHAGLNAEEHSAFRDFVHGSLRSGKILLLVDGLDEISDEGARQTFTNHLRTFIAMFPQAALVITSREAGFRLVASVVAGACVQAKLAPFDEDDVISLSERWHIEVVGDTEKVRKEARELGQAIWDNGRIRTLTENPLLLTTLLVVKRCVGELPRSRTTLYKEAIRVLVRTWNVEGYAPLDEDEALAQLSYVACAMMAEGKQQVGQKALLKLLQEARRELEAELQFARISPQDFIHRIEYRSSLLMQTGHARIDGDLQPVFEFRHLTFQEYLAARGYVEEQFPGRDGGRSLAEMLDPHFADERWREVIPLAAVLAGRKAEDLIKRLTAACERPASEEKLKNESNSDPVGNLLFQCIRDEVQVTPPTLRLALHELARSRRNRASDFEAAWVAPIMRGKFGAVFQEVVEQSYLGGGRGFEQYAGTFERISIYFRFNDHKPMMSASVAESLRSALQTGQRVEKIRAALVCMWLAYTRGGDRNPHSVNPVLCDQFQRLSGGLSAMLTIADPPSALAASWALAWIGDHRLLTAPPKPETLLSFFQLWRGLEFWEQARFAAWGLGAQKLLDRDTFRKDDWGDCDEFLLQAWADQGLRKRRIQHSAFVVGWYRRSPWTDLELVDLLKGSIEQFPTLDPTVRELLANLGNPGQEVLSSWDQKQAELKARREGDA